MESMRLLSNAFDDFLTTPAMASGDESGDTDQTDASQPAAIEYAY